VKTNGNSVSGAGGNGVGPSEPDASKLARLIAVYAPHDADQEYRQTASRHSTLRVTQSEVAA